MMKRFVKYSLFFILPIIIFSYALELDLRGIPNDYIYKNRYMEHHGGAIEVLIFGSSHAYYGINPAYFQLRTFSLAHVSQQFLHDYLLLEKYIDNLDSLKTVVIPISYHSMFSSYDNMKSNDRIKNYYRYYELDTLASFRHHFELFCSSFSKNVKRVFHYHIKDETDQRCSDFGWGKKVSSPKGFDFAQSALKARNRHTRDNINSDLCMRNYQKNYQFLIEIIDLCNMHNVSVLMVSLPTHYTYRELLNVEQLEVMRNTGKELSEKFKNCEYYDLLDRPDFTDQDFFDADHLSESGAKRISLILNGKLK